MMDDIQLELGTVKRFVKFVMKHQTILGFVFGIFDSYVFQSYIGIPGHSWSVG